VSEQAGEIYAAINSRWREAGLMGRLVMQTPRFEAAVEAVREFCPTVGWHMEPMGPVSSHTWETWLHNLSHAIDRDGHSLAHAKLEQRIQAVMLAALGL